MILQLVFSSEPKQHTKASSFWQSFSSEDQNFKTVQLSYIKQYHPTPGLSVSGLYCTKSFIQKTDFLSASSVKPGEEN